MKNYWIEAAKYSSNIECIDDKEELIINTVSQTYPISGDEIISKYLSEFKELRRRSSIDELANLGQAASLKIIE